MMNSAVAKHLNDLFQMSVPIEIGPDSYPVITKKSAYRDSLFAVLYTRLKPILDNAVAHVTAREIHLAAVERRMADVNFPELNSYWWGRLAEAPAAVDRRIPWYFTRFVWEHAAESIAACVAQYNAERMYEYETYRLACSQGVAVAPQET